MSTGEYTYARYLLCTGGARIDVYLEMYNASTKGGTHVVANTKMSLCRNKS